MKCPRLVDDVACGEELRERDLVDKRTGQTWHVGECPRCGAMWKVDP